MNCFKTLLLAVFGCAAVVAWAQPAVHTPQIIMVTAPNAGTNADQGTYVNGITQKGTVIGWYVDNNGVSHGFVKPLDGPLTTVDGPNALFSWVEGMNSNGEAAGYYADANFHFFGFVWTAKNGMTSFDVPGAGEGSIQGTYVTNINDSGTVNGLYFDSNEEIHGFLRKRNGEVTTFEVPGAGDFNVWPGTFYGMNNAGALVGTIQVTSENTSQRVWLRTQQGVLNFIDAPGSANGTQSYAINVQGAIAGSLADAAFAVHAYVRDEQGNFDVFDIPEASGGGISPVSLNASNQVVGTYWDATGNNHGFVRAPDGTIKTIDMPGAGTANNQGTYILGNNAQGWLTGQIKDKNFVTTSFVMIP